MLPFVFYSRRLQFLILMLYFMMQMFGIITHYTAFRGLICWWPLYFAQTMFHGDKKFLKILSIKVGVDVAYNIQ
jgi:Flp pilus assembly protein protease CpaA